MQKKAGKIYFIDKELTDAEVNENYVYPCMFFISETIIDELGQPYDILKHIVYNRFGIKSVRVYGGGGGGDQDLSSVLGYGNIMDDNIIIQDDLGFEKIAGDNLGITISDKYDDNSGKVTILERVVDANNSQNMQISTDFVTNNPYYNIYLNRKNAGVNSEATFIYDITRGMFSDKDFSSGYVNNSFIQNGYFLNNRNRYTITTVNSTPNKTWTDGNSLWFTSNAGINFKIATDLQVYKTITGNVTIDDSYHGAICRITANSIITFPSTLRTDFVTFFESVGTAKGTMTEGSGVTFDAPFGKVLGFNGTGYVLKSGASSFRINGSFSNS